MKAPHIDRSKARFFSAFAIAWLLQGMGVPSPAQEFSDSQRVTAIDLSVALEGGAFDRWLRGDGPLARAAADDFEIDYAGSTYPALLVQAPGLDPRQQPDHRIVLYFDLQLSTDVGAKQAASALAERADQLVALGEVEILVADPQVGQLLAATRDAGELATALVGLAAEAEAEDALGALRAEALEARNHEDVVGLLPELGAAAVASERQIVHQQLDQLLLRLTTDLEPARRRLLFLVQEGFDLEPEQYYARSLGLETVEVGDELSAPTGQLSAATETAGRVLAAYGWVVFGLAPAPPQGPEEALRVGRWRFSVAEAETQEGKETPLSAGHRGTQTFLGGVRIGFEEHRRPERARAYLELGAALEQQGKLHQAEEALRKALYHFADDPKTAAAQAEALAALAVVLTKQGESQKARAIASRLFEAYPDHVTTEAAEHPVILEPFQALRLVSRATSGRLLRGSDALEAALAGLDRRLRVVFQVEGRGDGEIHPVAVRFADRSFEVTAPAWGRHSTPREVAALRARSLLAGNLDLERTDLPFSARLPPLGGGLSELEVEVPRAEAVPATLPPNLRLTLAFTPPDSEEIEVRQLAMPASEAEHPAATTRWLTEVSTARRAPMVAVLVEDLDQGIWGARLLTASVGR